MGHMQAAHQNSLCISACVPLFTFWFFFGKWCCFWSRIDLGLMLYNLELEFSEGELAALERVTIVADNAGQVPWHVLQRCCCLWCYFNLAIIDLTDTNQDDHEYITEYQLFGIIVVIMIIIYDLNQSPHQNCTLSTFTQERESVFHWTTGSTGIHIIRNYAFINN